MIIINNINFTTKRDIILILCILLIAFILILISWLSNRNINNIYGEILLDGVSIKTISLDIDTTVHIEENPEVIFQVLNGGIGFIKSDCPDQVCVHSGFLTRPGQIAACLPNGLTLMLYGEDVSSDTIDIFTS